MGSNKEITQNLGTIGISAFFMTVIIMVFSIGAIFIMRKMLHIDRFGRLASRDKNTAACGEGHETMEKEQEPQKGNTMAVIIIISVIIGMLLGYFAVRRIFAANMETFEYGAGLAIKIGLCLLLVFVGMDLGIEGTVAENFKTVGLRILAVPAAVIAGTLAASLIMSFFLDITAREAMAIGAGFGWYTLAPGIIMEAGHMTASAICFLHNVMRELFSIVLIPLVAQKIGYIESVAMPGAAAMDVCLPIVERATRSDIAIYSFVSGVVLSILVPVLVPIIIG